MAEHDQEKNGGIVGPFLELLGGEKREEKPEADEVVAKGVEQGGEMAESIGKAAKEGSHLAHGSEGVSSALGAVGAGLQAGKGIANFAKAKTVDDGNRALDDVIQGTGDAIAEVGPLGKAVGTGIKYGSKIARFMEDTSKNLGLYGKDDKGNNMAISDHAAQAGVDFDGKPVWHRGADGFYHTDYEAGPTLGGGIAAAGQAVADGLTFLPRLAGKAISSLFGPSEEEKKQKEAALAQLHETTQRALQRQEAIDATQSALAAAQDMKATYDQLPEGDPQREALRQQILDTVAAGKAAGSAALEQPEMKAEMARQAEAQDGQSGAAPAPVEQSPDA
jgi:hypothetical protein